MAMSAIEKAANKAAQKVRDAAHRQRAQEMRRAVEAAENAPDVVQAREAAEVARVAFDGWLSARNAKQRELEERIAALKAEIKALDSSAESEALNRERTRTADAAYKLKSERVAATEARFPDLAGHAQFYPAAWKPPADVLEKMEAARKAVLEGASATGN